MSQIITNYPWFKIKNEGIPKSLVSTNPFFQVAHYLLSRANLKILNKLNNIINWNAAIHLDRKCLKFIEDRLLSHHISQDFLSYLDYKLQSEGRTEDAQKWIQKLKNPFILRNFKSVAFKDLAEYNPSTLRDVEIYHFRSKSGM